MNKKAENRREMGRKEVDSLVEGYLSSRLSFPDMTKESLVKKLKRGAGNLNSIDLGGPGGTILTAAGATLATLGINSLRNWWFAPDLEITYLPKEPYRVVETSRPYREGYPQRNKNGTDRKNSQPLLKTAWERLGVRNTGLGNAEKVHGEISSMIDLDQKKDVLGLNTIFLSWFPDRGSTYLYITGKQPVAAGFAFKGEGWPGFTFYADQNTGHRGVGLYYEGKHYLAGVTFYGTNIDSKTKLFEIFNNGTQLSDFSVREYKIGTLASLNQKIRSNVPGFLDN